MDEKLLRNARPGDPTCTHMGKEIPCLVCVSPHGGITPDILTRILQHIDEHEVFKKTRADGRTPFCLVDGHNSRFNLKFVNYIRDEQHPWLASFGIPYGTHIWQAADSEEKTEPARLQKAKRKRNYYP